MRELFRFFPLTMWGLALTGSTSIKIAPSTRFCFANTTIQLSACSLVPRISMSTPPLFQPACLFVHPPHRPSLAPQHCFRARKITNFYSFQQHPNGRLLRVSRALEGLALRGLQFHLPYYQAFSGSQDVVIASV